MSDLRDLYQEVILDHTKRPRNRRPLEDAQHVAEGRNPLCGDHVKIYIKKDGDRIAEVTFEGGGCAISTASASLMTQAVKGKTVEEALELFEKFHDLVTGKLSDEEFEEKLGKLLVFSGVCEYPVRVKCATLPWHTLKAAIEGAKDPVSTENEA
ncbi:MAG: iron-sulfur cluster assembly scaffold protein [Candidatus Sumerlaea sp.]|nr:SUF system NifU family Fe-S cluster assembly protein [Candidatus Sumerlaea chitinivorans]GIX45402.1 MAG: iron-sulfur cluster assembly scaffold protein [Candidatus Sumerlaea sp.]